MKLYTTPESDLRGYHEYLDSRNEYTRVFDNDKEPSKSIAILSAIPICYKTKEGDFDLVELSFDIDKNNYVGSLTQNHDIWLKKNSKGIIALFGKEDKYYGYSLPEDCEDVVGELNGNRMLYKGIYPGIDLEIKNSAEGLEKNFIVEDFWKMRELSLSIVTHNVKVKWDEENYIFKVYSKEDELLWESRKIAGRDSSIRSQMGEQIGEDYIVTFEEVSPIKYTIKINYKKEFLKKVKFPIFIDPSVTWTYQFVTGATPRMRLKTYYEAFRTTDAAGDEPICGQVWDDWGPLGHGSGPLKDDYCRLVIYYPFDTLNIVSLKYACFRGFVRWLGNDIKPWTFIRRINSWPNGFLTPGWNNRPNDFSTHSYTQNSPFTMWNDFEITNIVKSFLSGVPNLGIQLDAWGYEATHTTVGWKRFFRGDEGPSETYWDHRNARTEAGGGAGKASHLYLVYENNRAPNKPGKPYFETTNGVIGDSAKLIYPKGTDPDGNAVRTFAKIYTNGNLVRTTSALKDLALSTTGLLYDVIDTSNRTQHPNGSTLLVRNFLRDIYDVGGPDSDPSDYVVIDPIPGTPSSFTMSGNGLCSPDSPNVSFNWVEPALRKNTYKGVVHTLPHSYEIGVVNTVTGIEAVRGGIVSSSTTLNLSSFSNISVGSTFRARIRTTTPYGTKGPWSLYTVAGQYIGKPNAPSLILTGATELPSGHHRPIIPIKLGADPAGTQREIIISCPILGYRWSSESNPSLFSNIIPKENGVEWMFFRPDKNLPDGKSTITIQIKNAGGATSSVFSFTVNTSYAFVFNFVNAYNNSRIQSKDLNDMIDLLKRIAAVYNYGNITVQAVAQGSYITPSNVAVLMSNLLGLENAIHGASGVGNTKLLLWPIKSTPITQNQKIMQSLYLEIKKQFENL